MFFEEWLEEIVPDSIVRAWRRGMDVCHFDRRAVNNCGGCEDMRLKERGLDFIESHIRTVWA